MESGEGIPAASLHEWQKLNRHRWYFPFWTFSTFPAGHGHDPLAGKVFPHDSLVWPVIFPPSCEECKCQVLPVTAGEIEEEIALKDAALPAERRRIVPPEFLVLTDGEAWLWASVRQVEYYGGLPVSEEWEPAQWHDLRRPV